MLEDAVNQSYGEEDAREEIEMLRKQAKKGKQLFCMDFVVLGYLQDKLKNLL
jgi:hypothetical protein